MDWKRFQQLFLSLPNGKPASGGQFVNCRCQECFDSMDPTSAHMYVYIPWSNDQAPWYYCHKCHSHGTVDHNKLIEWNIYDKSIAIDLVQYLNWIEDRNGKYHKIQSNRYTVNNTIVKNDQKTEQKREYISQRMGINLSIQDLLSLKIVLNLWDFLKENNIQNYTRDINIINDLDREFLGFLSVDNSYFNMRRTVEEGHVYKSIDKRYVNYNIFGKKNTNRFYTIPTTVNLDTTERIKLHIAEGPMDILSIYLNLRQKENGIYTSVAGANYLPVILYFLSDLQVPYIELHVYPDNAKEGSLYRMKKLLYDIPDPTIPFYIHRNMYPAEKDFGVPLNHIQESISLYKR